MARVEMVMPKMGESVMEGTIITWLKKVGDKIEQDESVLEVATDKVDTEVPATHSGILVEILAQEGEVVQVGSPIALIETEAAAALEGGAHNGQTQSQEKPQEVPQTAQEVVPLVAQAQELIESPLVAKTEAGRFYSPLVLNIARQEGISMAQLEQIVGTGAEGRVTKHDIFAYLKNRKAAPTANGKTAEPLKAQAPQIAKAESIAPVEQERVAPAATETPLEAVKPAKSYGGNVEIIQMDRMRKMIAQRMVESKRISPHVTSFVEADVTNIVNWRNKWKRVAQEREGIALTFTPIFIEAVAKAIQDFPKINCSLDGDTIILKKDINIGMAVALPNDNLIVPVIRNANHYNLIGLAKKVNDLAERARTNKLSPDDLSEGTYTVSNIGSFGNMLGTPIIMQPQVAILSLGAIVKKPAVVETEQGDMIGIRHLMYLSHSYDHRIVDGALGGRFVRRVADYLEKFDVSRSL
jgi:2-oxoglutarate dehydrogenase E2 component (dihydrolipoamide succinyltransferase)